GILLRTSHASYHAGKVIIASGAWLPALLPGFRGLLQIERQVQLWFKPLAPELFALDSFPIHLWEYEKEKMFYGFPDLGSGVKVAMHHGGTTANPVTADRTVHNSDIQSMR